MEKYASVSIRKTSQLKRKKKKKGGPKELKVPLYKTSLRCCWDASTCTQTLTLNFEWLLEINCHFKTTKVVHANPHLISY